MIVLLTTRTPTLFQESIMWGLNKDLNSSLATDGRALCHIGFHNVH